MFIICIQRQISTLCWGHRDSRLFLACGPALYVVRVEHRVASLQLLSQQVIASGVHEEKDVTKLNMPSRLSTYVSFAFVPTIKVEHFRSRFVPILHIKSYKVLRYFIVFFVSAPTPIAPHPRSQ